MFSGQSGYRRGRRHPRRLSYRQNIFVPVCKHGQMIMVAFIEDKFHFTGQFTVFLIIFQYNMTEIDFNLYRRIGINTGNFLAFESTT